MVRANVEQARTLGILKVMTPDGEGLKETQKPCCGSGLRRTNHLDHAQDWSTYGHASHKYVSKAQVQQIRLGLSDLHVLRFTLFIADIKDTNWANVCGSVKYITDTSHCLSIVTGHLGSFFVRWGSRDQ